MAKLIQKNIYLVVLGALGFGIYYFFFIDRIDTQWDVQNFPPSAGTKWVAFGDSLTHGAEVGRDQTYPHLLGEHYGVEIINSGINGDTTAGGLKRIQQDVMVYDPKVVLLGLGGNDMLQRKDANVMGQNLEKIVDIIQAKGALVVLIGVDGSYIYGTEYRKEFERVAKEKRCVYVNDVLKGVIGNRKLLLGDNLHPNPAGYEFITKRIITETDPWLSTL